MTPLDTLAPDQRAVLELVLRQGRSYGELSELLAIPERDVRARADAGLRALAGEPAAGVDSGRIADWLLGQQPDAEAERTRAAVARSPEAREWAAAAAERLGELGGAMPRCRRPTSRAAPRDARARVRVRCATTTPAAPAPRRSAAAAPRSSRLGGAILIGIVALLVGGDAAVDLRAARRRGRAGRRRRAATADRHADAQAAATTSCSRASATRRPRA